MSNLEAERELFKEWITTVWRPDDGAELLQREWPHFAFAAFQAGRLSMTASTAAPEALKAYDPNIRWAKQRVRLHLRQWGYSTTLEATVRGNCQGFDIFQTAINMAWEALPTRNYVGAEEPVAYVAMTHADGATLECEDDELKCEDWLAQMVVGMEIIGQEPEHAAAPSPASKEPESDI